MILAFLAAALVTPTDDATYASSASTAMLAEICAASSTLRADFCTGYAMATYDALSSDHVICPGPGASTLQLVTLARKYLADHPEDWNKQPSWVLTKAFKAAFPCH